MRLGLLLATLTDVNSAEGAAMARKILGLAHDKRPEQREGVRRVLPDRRAIRREEPDQRRGPDRRRHDEESMSVREVVSTSDTEASLSGTTFAGTPIEGSDSIVTVGCKSKGGKKGKNKRK